MTANPKKKQTEQAAAFTLVPAKSIARSLSCTPRYVHMLAEAGSIPSHRFGRACIRFDQAAVFKALGIEPGGQA